MDKEAKGVQVLIAPLERYFEAVELSVFSWDAASVFVNVLLLLLNFVLLGSVIVAALNLRASRRAQVSQVFQWAVQQMEEIKEDQDILMAADPDYNKWDEQQIRSANRVCNRYQRLAFMAEHNLIEHKYFIEMWGLSYAHVWPKVKDFVIFTRRSYGEPITVKDGAFSRRHFEIFAEKAYSKYANIVYR